MIKALSGRQWAMLALLALFAARGWIYASVLPLNGMPDELEHMAQIRLVQYQPLLDQGQHHPSLGIGPWDAAADLARAFNRASAGTPQPERPYGVAAGMTPHSGRSSVYYTALGRLLGWIGINDPLTAWYACRLISLGMGLAVIGLIFSGASFLYPPQSPVPLLAAALAGLIPQFAALAASVNPENLAALASALFFWWAARLIGRGASPVNVIGCGLALIAAVLVKKTALFLSPLIAVGLVVWIKRRFFRNRSGLFWGSVVVLCLVGAGLTLFYPPLANRVSRIIGLGFYRTYDPRFDWELFGQPGLWEIINDQIRLTDPGFWFHLKSLTVIFLKSLWAYFGQMEVTPDWYWYLPAGLVLLAGAVGCLRPAAGTDPGQGGDPTGDPIGGQAAVYSTLAVGLAGVMIFVRHVLLYPGTLAQGRYLFPTLAPVCFLWARGFWRLWPVRFRGAAAAGAIGLLWLSDQIAVWEAATEWFYRISL